MNAANRQLTVTTSSKPAQRMPVHSSRVSPSTIGMYEQGRREPSGRRLVLLGRLSRYFDFTEDEWNTAIEQSVPPKFLELNKKAFALGRGA